ncbi:MAG: hypothetical protein ACXVXP_14435, partial [Mycobacteriaceae bacterium]
MAPFRLRGSEQTQPENGMTLIHRRPMLGAVSLAVITLVAVGCSSPSADRGAGQTTTTQTSP